LYKTEWNDKFRTKKKKKKKEEEEEEEGILTN
jgi:hypothetical protein